MLSCGVVMMSLVNAYPWYQNYRFSKFIVFITSETEIIMVFTFEEFFFKIPFGYIIKKVLIVN